ncbi:MAG: enoyl-CoA hydratase/isomerase family protein [Sporichthyaceae bacterium]
MGESVTLEVRDNVGHVTLTQPDRGNPFDPQMCTEMALIASRCAADTAVRAVLITATGPFFSVGVDVKELVRDRAAMPYFVNEATAAMNAALSRFARMDAPVILAAEKMVVGGGVALTAAADFAVAARSVKFYAAYCGAGLSSDVGGTTYLPRRVGIRRAAEFLMRNQTWTAQEALTHGLISTVVEDGGAADVAAELAAELAAGPTRAYGEIKNLLLSTWEQPLETQLELEARSMLRSSRTDDAWAAMVALSRREKPVFEGR